MTFITGLPEETPVETLNETPKEPSGGRVVCDGNECRFVPNEPAVTPVTPVTPVEQPKKSFEERLAETQERIRKNRIEKEEKEKKDAILREKSRIQQGKDNQEMRDELAKIQRQREIEKEKKEKKELEDEKKRQLAMWRKEHGLPEEVK